MNLGWLAAHPWLILGLSIAAVVGLIAWARVHAFFALLAAAALVAVLAGVGPGAAAGVERVLAELGAMAGRIGFAIAVAAVSGAALLASGAADRIVQSFIAVLGERRAPLALLGAGFVLGVTHRDGSPHPMIRRGAGRAAVLRRTRGRASSGGMSLDRSANLSFWVRRTGGVLAALLVLAGCARPEAPGAAAAPAGGALLRLGNGAEPQDLDPHIMTAFTDQNLALALFEGLCALDERTSLPVPAAAESWSVSPDGLTWTFHLRAGLQWSNGEPLTTGDFVASWRRALAPALAAEYAYLLYPLENAEALNTGAAADFTTLGATAPDERTLRLTLARPTPYLPALTANPIWFPINPRVVARHGALDARGSAWTRPGQLVGNGPFVLTAWVPQAHVQVARNPRYWDAAAVALDGMTFFPTENPDVDERNFRAGQVDLTSELPLAKVDTYRREAPASLRLDPFLETVFLRFNTTRPPFTDARVRRALSLAIDRAQLARTLLRGTRAPAPHYTPPDCAGYTAAARVPTDFAAARALLAAAGFPRGRGFPAVEAQVRNDELHARMLEVLQATWRRELGITTTLLPVEQKTWVRNQQSLNYTLSSARWVGDFVDPVTFLDMFVGGGTNNWTGWADAGYDALIRAAAAAPDAAARFAAFQAAEARLLEAAPVAPVYFGARTYLIAPRVHGWEPALLGFHQYKKIRLDPVSR